MVKKYDVIIIGAGPAGSTTAQYIDPARSGVSVLLLDARRRIGLPLQCGEALPSYYGVKMAFPRVDCPELFDLPSHVIASEVHGIKLVLPRERNYFIEGPGLMIYRDKLDEFLFNKAIAAGAEYYLNTRVRKIEGQRVITNDGEFVGEIIIGADGPNSLVSSSCPAFAPNSELVTCAFVIAEGDFFENHIELWLDQRFPGGYFWLFPKNGEANIGLGVRGPKHVRAILNNMLENLASQRQFKIKIRGGGVVPVGGLKKRIASEHVALVGDAAGMVFPTNGGGTAQAMLGGKILGEVIHDRLPLSEYQGRIDKIMRPALKRSLRTRQLVDFARHHESLFLAVMQYFERRGLESFILG